VADESPELFDDIYLGLRAGGAARKQRRGEPLSAEEKEAIGRWQRLSLWRRFIAIGAFALGTFAGAPRAADSPLTRKPVSPPARRTWVERPRRTAW
jgi:hypothetical protein